MRESHSIRWTVRPGSATEAWGESGAQFEQVLGEADIVKDGPYRTIYRVHFAANDWHVKHCKVRGLRAWLREWLRPAKAKLEFRQIDEAWRRGVPTVNAVAFGVAPSQLPADSFLVTHTVADAAPLNAFLASHLDSCCEPKRRIEFAKSLGGFLARIHHAGLKHPDLHPGNILVRNGDGAPEFFLIDLHDVNFGRSLSRRASLRNLTVFNRWFSLRTHRSDRLRFWLSYIIERLQLDRRPVVDYFDCRNLEINTRRSNLRFWRNRMTHCLGTSRHFVRVQGEAASAFAPRTLEVGNLQQLLRDPDAPFRDPTIRLRKDSPSSTVAEIVLTVNGSDKNLIYKRFRSRSGWQRFASVFRRTKCLRSWILGNAFLDCLLPTARPLAAFERRRFGMAGNGYLLMEKIEHAIDLRQALEGLEEIPATQRPEIIKQRLALVARLIRQLHECGWSHRDLKAANILLAPDSNGIERAWFVDLVGAHRPLRLSKNRRMRDLARLNASFLDSTSLSRSDRLHFLFCYLNSALVGREGWKDWWRGVSRRTLEKVAKNRERGRLLA